MPADDQAGAGYTGVTVREALALVAHRLARCDIDTPQVDARRLVAAAIGGEAIDLIGRPEHVLTKCEADTLARFEARRSSREPVSRILGSRGFYGRSFHITPATLDPRPCSETLIEAALELVDRQGWRQAPLRILDVGTGSGCLLLTLLAELPLATGVGTDISADALEAAGENGRRLGLGDRVRLCQRSYLDAVEETFDLLVANPPYIESGDIAGLEPEVRDFDPLGALDGGVDGLNAYRSIAAKLMAVIPRGWAVFEVGASQGPAVAQILQAAVGAGRPHRGGASGDVCRTWNDLGGHVRCVAIETQR